MLYAAFAASMGEWCWTFEQSPVRNVIEMAKGRWMVCFIFVFAATLHFSTGYAQKNTGQPAWGKIFNLFYPTIIEIVCGNSDPGFSAAVTVLPLAPSAPDHTSVPPTLQRRPQNRAR